MTWQARICFQQTDSSRFQVFQFTKWALPISSYNAADSLFSLPTLYLALISLSLWRFTFTMANTVQYCFKSIHKTTKEQYLHNIYYTLRGTEPYIYFFSINNHFHFRHWLFCPLSSSISLHRYNSVYSINSEIPSFRIGATTNLRFSSS
jgi:hypothetical protein